MKNAFVASLDTLMKKNKDIITLTADMGYGVFEEIQKKYPGRLINTGVTEQATASISAGMALSGYTIFYFAQAIFITARCFEQVRLDIAYSGVNVKLIGCNAGLSLHQYGLSHFAVEDVALMRLLSGMTVFTPGDPYEMEWAMNEAYRINGPVYIRYSKTGGKKTHKKRLDIKVGEQIRLRAGKNAALFVSGSLLNMVEAVVIQLEKKGLKVSLYSAPSLKPFDNKKIIEEVKAEKAIFTIEEHSIQGGLGTIVAEILAEQNLPVIFHRFGLPDKYTSITGSVEYLLDYNGISVEKLSNAIMTILSRSH